MYIFGIVANNVIKSGRDFVLQITHDDRLRVALLNRLAWVDMEQKLFVSEKASTLKSSVPCIWSKEEATKALDALL